MSLQHVAVSGWTGTLGQALTPLLRKIPQLTLISRNPPPKLPHNAVWQQMDMSRSAFDLDLAGVDVLFHLASHPASSKFETEVGGTRRLMEIARRDGVGHVVLISIVGIERVPIKYYRLKLEVEKVVKESGLPFSILRTTQFFAFIHKTLADFHRLPIAILPREMLVQPLSVQAVAQRLYEIGIGTPVHAT
ncbi:MAG: NAD(P)H-binding protein, partial [Bacteroidota bacterium]